MSGVGIHIEADFQPIYSVFGKMVKEGSDTSELMDAVGLAMVSSTVDRFSTGSGPDGSKWKPVLRGGSPLVDEGLLRGSMTYLYSDDEVLWGSNMVYAAIHQFGGKAGRNKSVKIDARPFVGVSDDDEAEIEALAYDFLEDIYQ